MPLARMILSSAQRCSVKRLVIAAPSASAIARSRPVATRAPVPASAERTKRRRSMTFLRLDLKTNIVAEVGIHTDIGVHVDRAHDADRRGAKACDQIVRHFVIKRGVGPSSHP